MAEVGIVMTIYDKISPALKTMTNNTKAFDKAMDDLEQGCKAYDVAQKALAGNMSKLRLKLVDAKAAVKEAEKAYKQYGDELSKKRLESAIREQEDLQRQLNDTKLAMKENEQAARSMAATVRSQSSSGKSTSDVGQLMDSGMKKMLGDSVAQFAKMGIESMFGQPMADAVNSTLSGVASGWAMGSALGHPISGALIGGAAGAISGATQIFSAQDDAYKSWYVGLYENASASTDDSLSSGTTIAGSREQTRMTFAQRLGSDEAADAYLEQVKVMAMGTNYSYDEITGYSKSLLNTYDPEAVFGVLQTLSDASAGLNLGQSDVNVMIQGLARMRTTGKATQEYLNYFSERGVDVYQALANTTGADKSQIAGMVSGGQISGETAAQAILDYINEIFGGLSEKLAGTYDAMVDNLADTQAEIDAAMGAGYNSVRVTSIGDQIETYGGELGDALSKANHAIGAGRAALDNLADQYTQEALGAVLLGQETTLDWSKENLAELDELSGKYQEAMRAYEAGSKEAGVQVEAYLEEARALAEAQYDSSEASMNVASVERELITAINNNTSTLQGWKPQFVIGESTSKGMVGGKVESFFKSDTGKSITDANLSYATPWLVTGFATGLQRVPYDNFPALLHEGERVLTASEARNYNGGSATVNVSGNTFVVRQDSDVDAIAAAIADKIALAQMGGVAQ